MEAVTLKFRGLEAGAGYAMKGYVGATARADGTFYDGTLVLSAGLKQTLLAALGDLPILAGHAVLSLAELGLPALDGRTATAGKDLLDAGLTLKPGMSPQVMWILYQGAK